MIAAFYYEHFMYSIFEYAGISDWEFRGAIYTPCSNQSKMPSLFFQIDFKWIEARPEDYMFDEE